MALSNARKKELLALNLPESNDVRRELQDYLARTGLNAVDFARRINYSSESLHSFINGRYHRQAASDAALRAAILNFIHAHPVAVQDEAMGPLYETSNTRLLRKYFRQALEKHRAIYVHGAPGSQKTFVLQNLVAELNRTEIPKNGHGRRAFYVYCRQDIRPTDLMKRIAESAGSLTIGSTDRILRNLRFDWRGRDVLLVLDEAQHLSVDCFETVRELLDRPPYCGLLFAGSHQLQSTFTLNAMQLEQWNSRFHFGEALPGISDNEAEDILRAELGDHASKGAIEKLVRSARAKDLRNSGAHEYISARRLFWSIRDLKEKLQPQLAPSKGGA